MKAVRIAYVINTLMIILLFCYLLVDPFNFQRKDEAIGLAMGLGTIFSLPFLEVPMLVICAIGAIKDRRRLLLYIITSLIMISGLWFSFVNKNIPLP